MSGIEQSGDGRAAFVGRQHPYHRLGSVIPDGFTAEEGLAAAHLDYTVTKEPLTAQVIGDDGTMTSVPVPGKYATVRTNPWTNEPEVLGVVGEVYEPVQNAETAGFLNALVGESGAHFETMGGLSGGRKTFISMRAPKGLMVGGRDAVDLYVIARNAHDGSAPFGVFASPIRPECSNTLYAGLRSSVGSWSTRHTNGAALRIEEAQSALQVMWNYADEFGEMADQMIATPLSDREFGQLLEVVFPVQRDDTDRVRNTAERKRGEVKALYRGETNAEIVGTNWGAWQALTEWADWAVPVRAQGGDDAKAVARAERVAAGTGWVQDFKESTLHLLAPAGF